MTGVEEIKTAEERKTDVKERDREKDDVKRRLSQRCQAVGDGECRFEWGQKTVEAGNKGPRGDEEGRGRHEDALARTNKLCQRETHCSLSAWLAALPVCLEVTEACPVISFIPTRLIPNFSCASSLQVPLLLCMCLPGMVQPLRFLSLL